MGAGFQAAVLNNTSSYVDATQFIVNASFPNTFPNESIPNYEQAENIVYLPPGSKADLWLLFYISFFPSASGNINQTSNFKLQVLTYNDIHYGGTYMGPAGGFGCLKVACERLDNEFIIKP